jgi:hypothetical protein
MKNKKLSQEKFDSLKIRKMVSLSFTNLSARVSSEYKITNPSDNEDHILVRCSQDHPTILKQIDKENGAYLI